MSTRIRNVRYTASIRKKLLVLILCTSSGWMVIGCIDPLIDLGGDEMRPSNGKTNKPARVNTSQLKKEAIQACYDLLGVNRNADLNVVEKARRKRGRAYHPDRVSKHMPDISTCIETELDTIKKELHVIMAGMNKANEILKAILEKDESKLEEENWQDTRDTLLEALQKMRTLDTANAARVM